LQANSNRLRAGFRYVHRFPLNGDHVCHRLLIWQTDLLQELGIRNGTGHISPLELKSSLQGRTHPRLAPTISNILNSNLTETPSQNARSVQIDTSSVTFSGSAPDRESSALCNYKPAHKTSPSFKLSESQSDEGVTVNSHEHNNRHDSHIHNDDLLSDTREGLVRPVCTKMPESVSDEGDDGLECQHEGADLGRVYGDDASRQNSRLGQQEQAEPPE
jgi:hypothetical protein